MMIRKVSLLLLFIFGIALGAPFEAPAQRWLQTAQLVTPIENDGPTRALLDTLVQVIERRDSAMVRRSPESSESVNLSELREKLINEAGIGLASANKAFIDYKFEIRNRGFQESIEGFRFVYRPRGGGEEDISMMYIDANKPWVKKILRNKGTSLRSNQAALKTFSDQLAFARLQENGKIVEIAGKTVRNSRETKKRNLIMKITRLTYESR